MTRLVGLDAFHVRVPLRRKVRHASHTRTATDNLIVRATLDDGTAGWGEGVPREYVTGESIESARQYLMHADLRSLAGSFETVDDAKGLWNACQWREPPVGQRECFGNSARCAVELAWFDALARRESISLSTLIGRLPEAAAVRRSPSRVQYTAPIMSVKPWKEAAAAFAFRLHGFAHCKIKLGAVGQNDAATAGRIRRAAGARMDLRADANEAWHPHELSQKFAEIAPFGISVVEQPVRHGQVACLQELRASLPIPMMLDESLCSVHDARRAIELELCDWFNLRLSKCGGILNCLSIATIAKGFGIQCQLGCMVGETAILSAAGRAFAAVVRDLKYVEGSYDRFLLRENVSAQPMGFGRGGWAKPLNDPGLGICVLPEIVDRLAFWREDLLQ